jgi:hypothetical protein
MKKDDKPTGARLGWRCLAAAYPFERPWCRLRQDRSRVPGDQEIAWCRPSSPRPACLSLCW